MLYYTTFPILCNIFNTILYSAKYTILLHYMILCYIYHTMLHYNTLHYTIIDYTTQLMNMDRVNVERTQKPIHSTDNSSGGDGQ